VRVPAGKFTFGAENEDFSVYLQFSRANFPGMLERLRRSFVIPPQRLELPEFHIDQLEATNQQYREFVLASGYQPVNAVNYLKHWSDAAAFPTWAATFPVVWISQQDAEAYCRWRGGRLPSEQEWEKAARGGDARRFPWGSQFPSLETANFGSGKLEPAGNRPGDRSLYDAYDLGGNVSEITSSFAQEEGESRVVVRGGNFASGVRETLAFKRTLLPAAAVRSETAGCRCVVDEARR
jgi:formylglycine-generating enzyme required for sulfatase activity